MNERVDFTEYLKPGCISEIYSVELMSLYRYPMSEKRIQKHYKFYKVFEPIKYVDKLKEISQIELTQLEYIPEYEDIRMLVIFRCGNQPEKTRKLKIVDYINWNNKYYKFHPAFWDTFEKIASEKEPTFFDKIVGFFQNLF